MLIHKTMKMPTSCLSCWIAPTCDVWVREKSKHKGYDERLDGCPIEEVKHGHWEFKPLWQGTDAKYCECSVCKKPVWWVSNYCPHCGAKMDEVME